MVASGENPLRVTSGGSPPTSRPLPWEGMRQGLVEPRQLFANLKKAIVPLRGMKADEKYNAY